MNQRHSTATARKNLATLLRDCAERGERVKITRYNKTIAVLVPKRDLDRLEECEEKSEAAKRRRTRPRPQTEADGAE